MRVALGLRAIWGTVLLVAPGPVLGDLPHQRIDRPARLFARVLGARHLIQAAITFRRPSRGWILAGAAVDFIHAATLAILAVSKPDRRALALTNVATATAFAAAGITEVRRL